LGRADESWQLLQEVFQKQQQLRSKFSDDTELAIDFAMTLQNLGRIHQHRGQQDEALVCFEEAVQLNEKIQAACRDQSLRAIAQDHLATTLNSLAVLQRDLGDMRNDGQLRRKALQSFARVLDIRQEMEYSSNDERLARVADARSNFGTLLMNYGALDQAQEQLQITFEDRSQLFQLHPTPELQHDLIVAAMTMETIRPSRNPPEPVSEGFSTRIRPLAQDLCRRFPKIVGYRETLAKVHFILGGSEQRQGRHESAVSWFEAAIRDQAAVIVCDPQLAQAHFTLAAFGQFRRDSLQKLDRANAPLPSWEDNLMNSSHPRLAACERGVALALLGYHQEAAEWLTQFAIQTDDPPDILSVMKLIRERLNQADQ
jgi:tetratricopeptide (TPR) repeat protein